MNKEWKAVTSRTWRTKDGLGFVEDIGTRHEPQYRMSYRHSAMHGFVTIKGRDDLPAAALDLHSAMTRVEQAIKKASG